MGELDSDAVPVVSGLIPAGPLRRWRGFCVREKGQGKVNDAACGGSAGGWRWTSSSAVRSRCRRPRPRVAPAVRVHDADVVREDLDRPPDCAAPWAHRTYLRDRRSMALSAALTLLAMAPVGSRILQRATPSGKARSRTRRAWSRGSSRPPREPMAGSSTPTRPNASACGFSSGQEGAPEAERAEVGADDFVVLVPAFVTSELYEAFALGSPLFALPHHRSRRGQRSARARHADAESHPGQLALQAAAVRRHRRLGSAVAGARLRLPVLSSLMEQKPAFRPQTELTPRE